MSSIDIVTATSACKHAATPLFIEPTQFIYHYLLIWASEHFV